jgi:glyoxylase-like metal-dependent hydrolase (beta-lactamase superfamily II)
LDGDIFKVEGATIRAVHSPGHSHDHMCFVLDEENAMFTGDNVLGHGSSAVEELSIYMSSLRKMQAQNCTTGYPAHGIMITDLQAKIASELAQKLRRERQVLQTLGEIKRQEMSTGRRKIGSVTVKELVTTMYGESINSQVREQALEPFMDEVVRKLAADGKVAFEIREGEKRWFGLSGLTGSNDGQALS